MTKERFITSELNVKDESAELPLRPQCFSDFPGQDKVKERLEILVGASLSRGELQIIGATTIEGDNARAVLFVGSGNTLYNPPALPTNMKGMRAYFQLNEETSEVRAFRMDFGDDETGIYSMDNEYVDCEYIYDLQGRRMKNNSQLRKGVYIVNGKREIIK